MFAVIARFPIAPAHEESFLLALDDSLVVAQRQPGSLAYQVLEPSKSVVTRVCLMLWESRQAFQAFLMSEDSKRAHADVRPEFFSEKPSVEELAVLTTWHAQEAVA
jgi:heme-degrading monooxygenase HmoA